MNTVIQTDTAPPAFSDYAQGIETPAGARWLHVSGQVGARPDGSLPDDPRLQHELAWANCIAILNAAGMGRSDIVDVLGIVTSHEGVPLFREVRDRMLGGHFACSTLLVSGLANPDWQVEIAVRAARQDSA